MCGSRNMVKSELKHSRSLSAENFGDKLLSQKGRRQLLRYAVVGVLTNSLGYVAYLVSTYVGGTPKSTMTTLYIIGVLISFLANRSFTFQHNGPIGAAGMRFLAAHLMGYLLNLFLLFVLVDKLSFPHQYIQGMAIIIVAFFLFVLSRAFVFAPYRKRSQ